MKLSALPSLLLVAPLLTSATPLHSRHLSSWPAPIREFYCAVSDRISRIAHTPSHIRSPTGTSSSASMPACSLASAQKPSSSLPPPSPGLVPYHIAVGRGTQNYTCPSGGDPSAAPTALGAVALLFNASCLAAINPNILALVPAAALSIPTPRLNSKVHFPTEAFLSRPHYISDATTAVFNLHTSASNYGISFMRKIANVTAPASTPQKSNLGPDGSKALPWLKLQVRDPNGDCLPEDNKGVKEIYRVNTQGGSPPKTCAERGKTGDFTVEYSSEYWFYAPASSS